MLIGEHKRTYEGIAPKQRLDSKEMDKLLGPYKAI